MDLRSRALALRGKEIFHGGFLVRAEVEMTPREEALLKSVFDPRILRGWVRLASDHIDNFQKK